MKKTRILSWTLAAYMIVGCHAVCSNLYGGEPCSFVPAPPGKTPPCARPGLTYCEDPDHYPGQLINYLIQKWRFDHSTLFTDETTEQFSSYIYPPPSTVYGPPKHHGFGPQGPKNVLPGPNNGGNGFFPEPIDIPKPLHTFQEQGLTYIPPKINPTHNFSAFLNPPYRSPSHQAINALTYKYTSNIPQYTGAPTYNPPFYPQNTYYAGVATPQITQYNNINDVWKGSERVKRSLVVPEVSSNSTVTRNKRQSTLNREQLCATRSQFIMPRAALNKDGNWMYVVNMPEVDNRYTQLVKSETCASQTCNGICSLPQGYSSRCEQRYVQKRLLALEGGGSQLYNDVFWFPSCCICTISNT